MLKPFRIGFDRVCEESQRSGRLVVSMAMAAFLVPLGGCWVGGSSGGEGTVDISRAKEASLSNPDMSKAAAARGKGEVVGDALKKGRR
jgi:hypothetical protein